MGKDKVVVTLSKELWNEIVTLLEGYDDCSDNWLMRQLGFTCCLFKQWEKVIEDGQRITFSQGLYEIDDIDGALDRAIQNRRDELELLLRVKEKREKMKPWT